MTYRFNGGFIPVLGHGEQHLTVRIAEDDVINSKFRTVRIGVEWDGADKTFAELSQYEARKLAKMIFELVPDPFNADNPEDYKT
mgnify:CR=1 FL=1